MVQEVKGIGWTLFACEKCWFAYAERSMAEKCEEFCSKHKVPSPEITKRAFKRV